MRLLRAFILLLITILVTDSVYAGSVMLDIPAPANHQVNSTVSMHDGHYHGHSMHQAQGTPNVGIHDSQSSCHDCKHCFACIPMIPVALHLVPIARPQQIALVAEHLIYQAPATALLQRPPISL